VQCPRNALYTIWARREAIVNQAASKKEIEMSRFKPFYTLAVASTLAGVLAGCADFRECGSQSCASDAKLATDVETKLNQMPELGPPGSIRVQTINHVVYLDGEVDGGLDKRNAEAVVRRIPGVEQIENDIDVQHD
jgi:osmotically-inducible protein OsmY